MCVYFGLIVGGGVGSGSSISIGGAADFIFKSPRFLLDGVITRLLIYKYNQYKEVIKLGFLKTFEWFVGKVDALYLKYDWINYLRYRFLRQRHCIVLIFSPHPFLH